MILSENLNAIDHVVLAGLSLIRKLDQVQFEGVSWMQVSSHNDHVWILTGFELELWRLVSANLVIIMALLDHKVEKESPCLISLRSVPSREESSNQCLNLDKRLEADLRLYFGLDDVNLLVVETDIVSPLAFFSYISTHDFVHLCAPDFFSVHELSSLVLNLQTQGFQVVALFLVLEQLCLNCFVVNGAYF